MWKMEPRPPHSKVAVVSVGCLPGSAGEEGNTGLLVTSLIRTFTAPTLTLPGASLSPDTWCCSLQSRTDLGEFPPSTASLPSPPHSVLSSEPHPSLGFPKSWHTCVRVLYPHSIAWVFNLRQMRTRLGSKCGFDN